MLDRFKSFFNNKTVITLIQIIVFPIFLMIFNVFISCVINMGTMFGTFIRGIYELIV